MHMNQVNLMGRLTADPELHVIDANTSVSNIVIACERRDREKTDFIRCVAWNKKAQILCDWFSKGQMIAICGRLQTRTYEKNGETRFWTEVLITDIFFTGEHLEKQENETKEQGNLVEKSGSNFSKNAEFDLSEFEEILSDEEIPF